MSSVHSTPEGNWRARWRDPSGRLRSKTFPTKREARAFLAEIDTTLSRGTYVDPHAGRMPFRNLAQRWLAARNTQVTTAARDESVMRTHVLPQWGDWPLAKIDHLSVQEWVTELSGRRSAPVVAKCHQLTSSVLRAAVRDRLIAINPCEGVRLPTVRRAHQDERIISQQVFRDQLLPAVPDRYRAVVATAGGGGLRWGEVAGLCRDALDLDAGRLRVVRTVVEVAGHTAFKPYPKSVAGQRSVPLPAWLLTIIRAHLERWPTAPQAPVFANAVGAPLRRGLFRARVWRPSLVRVGLLGKVEPVEDGFEAHWVDEDGVPYVEVFRTHAQAVKHVARQHAGGMRFHDLRHSYATWLVDDGVPVNMVQRVMGHERSVITLDLYTRRTDNAQRIIQALTSDHDDDQNESADGNR